MNVNLSGMKKDAIIVAITQTSCIKYKTIRRRTRNLNEI